MSTAGVVLVLCTVPAAEARSVLDPLLRERRVACGNILGPFVSRYLWKGEIEEAEEVLLLMKAPADALPELRRRIRELHGYDVPEILEVAVEGGLQEYLDWVLASCAPRGDRPR